MDTTEYERMYTHELDHFWYQGLHHLVLSALRHFGAGDHILDAGCGTGGLLARLTAKPCAGLDASPDALRGVKRRGLTHVVQASVSAVPFRDGLFDAVVSCDVLYHRAVPDDLAALKEFARVVRPGGLILLNLPAHKWLIGAHDRMVHTARRYSRADIQHLASAAGLIVERITWYNILLFPLVVVLRLLSRSGTTAQSDVRPLPSILNRLLTAWMKVEASWTLKAPTPWGLSLFAVLRRPENQTLPNG